MTVTINVVVTCTQRKTLPVPRGLRAGSLRGAVGTRLSMWIDRLGRSGRHPVSAMDLYAGDAWSVVRSLAAQPPSHSRLRLWVCSAGYGLVPATAYLSPYGATFADGERDSVVTAGGDTPIEQRRSWWQGLSNWEGPAPGGPRTLAETAATYPRTPLLFVGSQHYLDAVSEDLEQARSRLAKPELLSILSAGTSSTHAFANHRLPYDARLQQVLGGALTSLNTRVLAFLLQRHTGPFTFESLSGTLRRCTKRLPDMPRHDRQPISDDDVRDFIRHALAENPREKHSPLLRRLRDTGYQCEQARFRRIYMELKERRDGQQ